MEKNIGSEEAHIRTIAGAVLILFAMFIIENATLRILVATLSAILAGTAFFRTCPLYYLLKKNTREIEMVDDAIVVEGESVLPEEEKQENTVETNDVVEDAEKVEQAPVASEEVTK